MRSSQRVFTEIAILVNYAGFTKKFFEIVSPFILSDVVPQLKFAYSISEVNASLLPYFTFFTLFSFQGAGLQPLLKPDLKTRILQALRSDSKRCPGGPKWARTSDLTIISRTL